MPLGTVKAKKEKKNMTKDFKESDFITIPLH